MKVFLHIQTTRFLNEPTPRFSITLELNLSRVPNMGEFVHLSCEDGVFYGKVTDVETHIDTKHNTEKIHVYVFDFEKEK